MLRASLPALRPWVTNEAISGPPQRTVISFPDTDFALALQTGGGTYQVQPARTDEADAQIDPVDLFLALANRRNASDPAAGRIAAWYAPI